MSKFALQRFALSLLLGAVPVAASAQDAAALLQPTAEALRAGDVRGLRVVASGSSYERLAEGDGDASTAAPQPQAASEAAASEPVGQQGSSALFVPPPPPPTRRYFRVSRHIEEIDLAAESLRIERVRAVSAAGDSARQAPQRTIIGARSPWSERLRYWTSPYGFITGALSRDDTVVGTETVAGVEYRTVTFTVDGGHEIRGYVGENDRLVRVRATLPGEDGEPTEIVTSFVDWEERGGVTFPATSIRKEDGELAEVLVVEDVVVRGER